MPFISMGISLICSSMAQDQKVNTDACSKAMEAGTKQTQAYQLSEKTENYFMDYGKKVSYDYLGKGGAEIVGSSGYIYKSIKDKAAVVRLPTLGICESANTRLSPNSYSLNLRWNLPW